MVRIRLKMTKTKHQREAKFQKKKLTKVWKVDCVKHNECVHVCLFLFGNTKFMFSTPYGPRLRLCHHRDDV